MAQSRFQREFERFYQRTRSSIFEFCKELDFKPSDQQAELLEAIEDAKLRRGTRKIACKSGQGPGKTTASAVAGMWVTWLYPNALTIVTAPTMNQCREVWLPEARRRLENAHPILRRFIQCTKTRIYFGDMDRYPDWGIKFVTATRPENAQGRHEKHMTWIAEEASGIPRPLVTQIEGTLSNEDSMLLMIGNPNTRECAFFDCFNSERHKWRTMTFNAEESPTYIVDPERNRYLEERYGRNSDVYRVRVLGEFPHVDPNCVISSEDAEKCTKTNMLEKARIARRIHGKERPARQFGIDLARFGSDESVIYRRSGNAVVEWRAFQKTDPADVIDCAFRMQYEAGWRDDECWYVVDAGGMGQGILHKFYRAGKRVFEFHNGGKAADSQYKDKITEAWFLTADLVRKQNCKLPNDNRLIQQLSSRQYRMDSDRGKNKIIVEPKDVYVKRGDYDSPDRAEALVMAFYDALTISAKSTGRTTEGKRVGAKVSRAS